MMQHNSKIYIAGHRGLVGSAIKHKFDEAGYSNIVTRTHAELDLTDQRAVASFFEAERPEYVILAAAKVGGIVANNTFPADFIYQNLMIQTNVIHQSYLNGTKKLLFLGSSCIYPKQCPQPIKEEYLLSGYLEPTNEAYAMAKIAGIKQCEAYNRQFGTHFISAMPTNLYGPQDNFDLTTSHVLPAMIRKCHLGRLARQQNWEAIAQDEKRFGPIPEDLKLSLGLPTAGSRSQTTSPGKTNIILWGSGAPRREFLHVEDLAAAILFMMTQPEQPAPAAGPSWRNIGTGKDITIKALSELIARVVGYDGDIIWDTTKPDGIKQKLLDTSVMQSAGWTPSIRLIDGLKSTYEWYLQQA